MHVKQVALCTVVFIFGMQLQLIKQVQLGRGRSQYVQ